MFNINVQILATNEIEAAEMNSALQSFVGHFNAKEMKRAAEKLKNPANRAMIKTFL
jgi:hypothetical protein